MRTYAVTTTTIYQSFSSLLGSYNFELIEILWTFSIFLESIAIVPQLIVLQRFREVENLDGHYIFLLGSYRALYILNWVCVRALGAICCIHLCTSRTWLRFLISWPDSNMKAFSSRRATCAHSIEPTNCKYIILFVFGRCTVPTTSRTTTTTGSSTFRAPSKPSCTATSFTTT